MDVDMATLLPAHLFKGSAHVRNFIFHVTLDEKHLSDIGEALSNLYETTMIKRTESKKIKAGQVLIE